MILDHVSLGVTDLAVSKAFYERALAPLGIEFVLEEPGEVGFGRDGWPRFFIKDDMYSGASHVAFVADDVAAIDAFHVAALAAGGTDNGAPGPRRYHARYYSAFVLDPDGHNIEAVTHSAG